MKEKTEKAYAAKENAIIDMTDQVLKNCEEAVRCGFKIQEEAARRWTEMMYQAMPTSQDWQNRFDSIAKAAKEVAPTTQKRMEEVMEVMNKNTKACTEMFKMATEAAQARTMSERQAACNDLWSVSLGAARSNAETIMQINNRVMDCWVEFVQKSADAAQAKMASAA